MNLSYRVSITLLTLLSVLSFPSFAQKDDDSKLEESAKNFCADKPAIKKNACVQERIALLKSPEHKAFVDQAAKYGEAIFLICQSLDFDKFRACSKKEQLKIPEKYKELAGAYAGVSNINSFGEQQQKRKEVAIANCKKSHIEIGDVLLGMSMQTVRDCGWGEPEKRNRTITKNTIEEQWVYGGGRYLYFRNGKLQSIQD